MPIFTVFITGRGVTRGSSSQPRGRGFHPSGSGPPPPPPPPPAGGGAFSSIGRGDVYGGRGGYGPPGPSHSPANPSFSGVGMIGGGVGGVVCNCGIEAILLTVRNEQSANRGMNKYFNDDCHHHY